jgi:hypothetical protein
VLTEAAVQNWPERRKRQRKDKRKRPPTEQEMAALHKHVGELGCWRAGEWVPAYWNASTVAAILTDRRVLGEFQPRTERGSKKVGDPIPGYYPRVIDEDTFLGVQAQLSQRRSARQADGRFEAEQGNRFSGRTGSNVNIFAGLLQDARGTGSFYARYNSGTKTKGRKQRVLINTASLERVAPTYTYPFDTFEAAILSCLKEIDPHDILNGDNGPDESLVLAGQLAAVESKIAELEAELLKGNVEALARVLRKLEDQKRDLSSRLAEARQKALHPLSETWGEAQTLMDAVDNAPDPEEARLRLRTALRRMIDSIWLLIIPKGRNRLLVAQIWFADGKRHRDYIILHRPATANKTRRVEGGWSCRSLASVAKRGELDLRKPQHAGQLETKLAAVDLDELR